MKTGIYSYVKENMEIKRKFLTSLCCLLLLHPILGFSKVKIVLVSDVSGSSVLSNKNNVVRDALITALKETSLNKYDWELGMLGSSISLGKTSIIDLSWNKTTLTISLAGIAMNFVGFPEDAILEFQTFNKDPDSITQAIRSSIREDEKAISSQDPNYEQRIKDTFKEIESWDDQRSKSKVFRHAHSHETFNAPVIVALSNNPDFLNRAEGKNNRHRIACFTLCNRY